jgi:hypothetical protein
MRLNTTFLAFVLAIALAGLPAGAESAFYVATNGSDANPGTRGRPFRTFERAREAVQSAGQTKARKVIVRGGTYEFSASFALGPLDSGTPKHPVIWEAAKGENVRLEGERKSPASAWQPVEDSATLQRLDPVAHNKVRKADLKALGISTPRFPIIYHEAPPGPELFYGDQRMRLACWPNQGWATIVRIVECGLGDGVEVSGGTNCTAYATVTFTTPASAAWPWSAATARRSRQADMRR